MQERRAEKEAALLASGRDWPMPDLMAKGEKVYQKNCAACHKADGSGMKGVFPAIAGSALATGALPGHLDIVMVGKPGTAMQGFAPQLSDLDLAAVITYQRNAFGNNTGDVVQPKDIKSAR
jgi:cytochrome c oxidase subunit 2